LQAYRNYDMLMSIEELKSLIKWGNYSVFNSPITYLGGSRDDNVADSNSPMRGNNSPINRKEQGTANIVLLLLVLVKWKDGNL